MIGNKGLTNINLSVKVYPIWPSFSGETPWSNFY